MQQLAFLPLSPAPQPLELDTTVCGTLLSCEEAELVIQFDTDSGIVDGSRQIVNHAVCIVRAVETLTIAVRQPVVDISFGFNAELWPEQKSPKGKAF